MRLIGICSTRSGITSEIAKNLIKLGVSDEKIVAATGLSLEEVVVLRSQLEA